MLGNLIRELFAKNNSSSEEARGKRYVDLAATSISIGEHIWRTRIADHNVLVGNDGEAHH